MNEHVHAVDVTDAVKQLKANPDIRQLVANRDRVRFDARVPHLLTGIDPDQRVLDHLWDHIFKSVTTRCRLSGPDVAVLLTALGNTPQSVHVQRLIATLAALNPHLARKNAGRSPLT